MLAQEALEARLPLCTHSGLVPVRGNSSMTETT